MRNHGLLLAAAVATACLLLSPGARAARDADDHERTHVIASGQTLGAIAKRYRVSVQEIRDANDIPVGQRLKPGTRLVIPSHDKALSAKKPAHDDDDADDDRKPEHKAKKGRRDADRDREDDADDDDAKHGRRGAKHVSRDADDGDDGKHAKGKTHPFRIQRGEDSWEGKVVDRKGKATPEAVHAFERVLKFTPTGKRHDINPRLVALVANVSDHFGGHTIQVVSGFRPKRPTQYTPHSRHNGGDAIDFHIEGVPNEELRDYCKTFSKVGVGFYPHSSFVHLDVRSSSATWVDLSGPGEAPRYTHDSAHHDDADDDDRDSETSAKSVE